LKRRFFSTAATKNASARALVTAYIKIASPRQRRFADDSARIFARVYRIDDNALKRQLESTHARARKLAYTASERV